MPSFSGSTMSMEGVPRDEWLRGLAEDQKLAILKLTRVFVLEHNRPRTKPGARRRVEVAEFMGELGMPLTLWPEVLQVKESLQKTAERLGYRIVPAGAVAMSFADARRILMEMGPEDRARAVRFIRKQTGI